MTAYKVHLRTRLDVTSVVRFCMVLYGSKISGNATCALVAQPWEHNQTFRQNTVWDVGDFAIKMYTEQGN